MADRTTLSRARIVALVAGASIAAAGASWATSAPPDWTLQVPDSPVVVRGWNAGSQPGSDRPHYAIALDGRSFSAPQPTSYELRLRFDRFDPLTSAGPTLPAELAPQAGEQLHVVQFVTQPLEAYRAQLRAAGAEVFFYLARHAHIVRMSDAVAAEVRAMPFVRWVGPLAPAFRLDEESIDLVLSGEHDELVRTYNVMLVDSDRRTKEQVALEIQRIGGDVVRVDDGKYLLRARLDVRQLGQVVRSNDVLFVDPWSPYEADMDIAREIGGANFIEDAPEGFTGDGVRGEVFDSGFNLSHLDFASRPLIQHGNTGSGSHGASTSGIVFGDGAVNPAARGLLPDGQGIVADHNVIGLSGPSRYTHTGELVEAPYFAVFQTASVGSNRTFNYTTISADTDAALFDFDVVHCQSQSNAGNQDSRPQAWAKNIIAGGGVNHNNSISRVDDFWGGGGSTGPASDGRIKPDLAHFYDDIFTVTSGSPTSYTSGFGGTSGATPIICGYVGLFFDMWADGTFGNPVDGTGDVFANRAHMTTAKAMVINTASPWDWTAGGPNSDITRFRQGWGMPDVRAMYELRDKFVIVDETDLLGNLETSSYFVTTAAGEPAFRATLVYADPPGVPNSDLHRVNDLTLRVTSPSGEVYWGNHGLVDGLWSEPGGEADTINTVENVFVENPEAGGWTIEVIASEIVQDGHVESPQLDADFALVVSGGVDNLPPLLLPFGDQINVVGDSVDLTLSASDPEGETVTYGGDLPPELNVDATSGQITGTLTEIGIFDSEVFASDGGAVGRESFVWRVTDVDGNSPPRLALLEDQEGITGTSISLQVEAEDFDGDALAFGSAGLPDGLSLDQATGLITGSFTEVGTYDVAIAVSDGRLSDLIELVWTVDDPPLYVDDFEATVGWTTNPDGTDNATTGFWQVGDPVQTLSDGSGVPIQLDVTTSGVQALVTDPTGPDLGCCDIDNGVTSVRSPQIALPTDVQLLLTLNYNFAHTLNATPEDFFRVTVEGESTDQLVFQLLGTTNVERGGRWEELEVDVTPFAGETVTLLIAAADNGAGSLIEAAVDDVSVDAKRLDGGDALRLAAPVPGRAGEVNTFDVLGATPSARVHLLFGVEPGVSPLPDAFCSGALPIDRARLGATGQSNGEGSGTIPVAVPPGVAGTETLFVVVEPETCRTSNLVTVTFDGP